MNARQKLFCKYYADSMNATEAARLAGYSARTAYSQGQRLLKNVEIWQQIKEELKEREKELPDRSEIKRFWANTMRDESEKISARLAASGYLAKALFMFNENIWEE